MQRWLLGMVLVLLSFDVTAFCGLSNTEAQYRLFSRKHHVGKVIQTINFSRYKYQVDSNTKIGFFLPRNFMRQWSKGYTTDLQEVQALHYEEKDKRKTINDEWTFDPTHKEIRGVHNHQATRLHPSRWPVYDRLSYQVALRCALRDKGFKQVIYPVLLHGKLVNYDIKLLNSHAKLITPAGKFDATSVRLSAMAANTMGVLWFSNDDDHLLLQSSMIDLQSGATFMILSKFKTIN